jgi:hypothetical protein
LATDYRSCYQQLHNLCGAVANLQPDHVAHPLLMRQIEAEPQMPMQEQTLMQYLG